MKINKVIKILMERDDIDHETAEEIVRETRDELLSINNPFDADMIMATNIELEPDYIFDVLNFR